MKPYHWILLVILIAVPALMLLSAGDSAPRVDERIDLNWKFRMGNDSAYSTVHYDDSDWEYVSLPHDWMITREINSNNPSGTAGGFYPGGMAWYRKDLYLGAYDQKEQFYLVFDGLYMNADIWVNGNNIGEQKYGYIGFHFDITPFVRKDTVNVIAVRTDCSNIPSDRWYSGAGIYRHVRLVATEKLHFPVHNTRVTTEERDGSRYVIAETDVVNLGKRNIRYKIRTDLLAPDGSLIESTVTSHNANGNNRMTVREELMVPGPQLWSEKDPLQYELRRYLIVKKKVSDQVATKFGIRDIAFSPTNGEVKPYAYFTQSIYPEQPMVKIAVVDRQLVDSLNSSTNWQIPWAGAPVVRHWNFSEQGNELQVVVYSNCPEVELSLNDSLLAQFARKNFEDGVIKTSVAFKPGAITARATYRDTDGEILFVKDSLVTAGPPYMILMDPDRKTMIAGGQDVVHIETRVTDKTGITSPIANNTISYQLDGPGKIKVIDNGDPNDHTPQSATAKQVRNGRHLLIIQSAMEPGDLIIRAKSEGLESAEVTVKSVAPEKISDNIEWNE